MGPQWVHIPSTAARRQRRLSLHFSVPSSAQSKHIIGAVLTCVSLMTKSNAVSCVDQPFGCPPLWSVCSRVFLLACLFLLNWSSSLHLTGRSPLPDVCLAQSFLRFIACLSILAVSLQVNRGFSFYYSPIHVGFSPDGSLFSESC